MIQVIKTILPDVAIALQPSVQLLKRLEPQLVYAPVGVGFDLDKPGFQRHLQMLRGLRLANVKPICDLSNRERTAA